MRIIGKSGEYQYICTIQYDEIARLAGFPDVRLMPENVKPAVGREVKVSDLYAALMVSRERKAEISKLADQLRSVAARVDTINQALAAPIVEVEVKS